MVDLDSPTRDAAASRGARTGRPGARAGGLTGRPAAGDRQPRRPTADRAPCPSGADRSHGVAEGDRQTVGDMSGLAFSPDSRWLAWSSRGRVLGGPRATSAAPDQGRRPRPRPGLRRHAAALHRHRAGVHGRRQAPGVPVGAQPRPGLRQLRVRPVVPERLPAPPGRRSRPTPRRRSTPRSAGGPWEPSEAGAGGAARPCRRRRTAPAPRSPRAGEARRRDHGRHRGPRPAARRGAGARRAATRKPGRRRGGLVWMRSPLRGDAR